MGFELILCKSKKRLCACGCGEFVKMGRVYLKGHWSRGKHRSKEVREKIRAADRSYTQTETYRQKMSEAKKGFVHSEETKEKMRQAALGRHFSKEHCLNISKATKGKPKVFSISHRKALSRKMQVCWNDPKFKAKRLACLKVGHCTFPNKPERKLRRILKDLFPGEYKYVGDGKVWINSKNPDFININGQKKIIEMFGDYWHSKEHTGIPNEKHERIRRRIFAKYGYETLIVWQKELQHVSALRRKLKDFHRESL